MITIYVRLLNYENAEKLIDFVNIPGKSSREDDYAWITPGGVGVQYNEECRLTEIVAFLETLEWPYEIGTERPHKVEAKIVADLKATI